MTYYFGPVRYPSLERSTSKTHSLHILGDMTVPINRREYRVIDGFWAQDAVMQQPQGPPHTVAVDLAPFLGSMINSSRKTDQVDNITTDALVHDQEGSVFAYESLTQSAVSAYLTDKQLRDSVLNDKSRPWMKLAMVSKRT